MSETMENAALNSGEIADRTPAAKAEETKADKFIRLGEYRMNKAIDAIGRIENLANRSAYEYTPEQVEAMFSVLESKVAEVKAKFTVTKNKENAEKLINFLCDPDNALQNVEYIGYSTPNAKTYEMLPDDVKNNQGAYPSDKVLDNCEVFVDLGDSLKLYDEAWMKIKTAK